MKACARCGAELADGWLRSRYTNEVYCKDLRECDKRAAINRARAVDPAFASEVAVAFDALFPAEPGEEPSPRGR